MYNGIYPMKYVLECVYIGIEYMRCTRVIHEMIHVYNGTH